jgi:Ca2+/H+ antiporter
MCVGLQEPSIRWFQKSSSLLGLTGAMTVTVLTETSLGVVVETPVGAGLLSNSWTPSLTGLILTNLLPLLPNNMTAVAFRFRAVTGSWNVDDVYVDPYQRR